MRLLGRLKRLGNVVYLVIWPVLAVFCLLILMLSLPEAVKADRVEGLRGTYAVTHVESCGRWHRDQCFEGTFTSADGTVELERVTFDGDVDHVGQVVQAQSLPEALSGSGVFSLNPHGVLYTLLLAFAAWAWLAYWVWKVLIAPHRVRS